jgi:hypothetical protein
MFRAGYVAAAATTNLLLMRAYAHTKSISETGSLCKKHNTLPHFQLIFPRQHGLYPPKGQEAIVHVLELYQ